MHGLPGIVFVKCRQHFSEHERIRALLAFHKSTNDEKLKTSLWGMDCVYLPASTLHRTSAGVCADSSHHHMLSIACYRLLISS